jgi:hypothetical protein
LGILLLKYNIYLRSTYNSLRYGNSETSTALNETRELLLKSLQEATAKESAAHGCDLSAWI